MNSLIDHPAFPRPIDHSVDLFPDIARANALTEALQDLARAIFPEATVPGPVFVNFGANYQPREYIAALWHSDLLAEDDTILRVRGASLEEAASLLFAALLEEACGSNLIVNATLLRALTAARAVVRPLGLRVRFAALGRHSTPHEETSR